MDEDQTLIHPGALVPIARHAQANCGHLLPLARSLLQIDSQMETSCKIPFMFVAQDQLVSYDYLQGPAGIRFSGWVYVDA